MSAASFPQPVNSPSRSGDLDDATAPKLGGDWGSHFFADGTPRHDQAGIARAGGHRADDARAGVGRRGGGGTGVGGPHAYGHTNHGDGLYSYTAVATLDSPDSNSTTEIVSRKLLGEATYDSTRVSRLFGRAAGNIYRQQRARLTR